MNITNLEQRGNIQSRDNLTLCQANYFEACWCKLNSTKTITCPYLLRHVLSSSNSSYFCIYHTIRKTIECFNSSLIFPKKDSVSTTYIYLTIFLFIIGLIGNGLSIIILLNKTLRRLNVYRNLIILCALNILYLLAILIRHTNNFHQDIRDISPRLCRLHTFIVAFTGHLCSWQLVSMSIQRVHALLSLQSCRRTSWTQTLNILLICIILPLFIFDGQLLFDYGLFYKRHICDGIATYTSKQYQRALHFPINNSKILNNLSSQYHTGFIQTQPNKPHRCGVCILWNIFDTFLYAIIPFLIILISSIIIILKICERRRSTVIFGGICHTNRRILTRQDNLSILLIIINCLFLIMTGPFNICLIIQSIIKYCFLNKSSMEKFVFELNQYLRSVQNSYHALSFIFYCVAGYKFRKCAWKMCQNIYYKLYQFCFGYQPNKLAMISYCLGRKHFIHRTPTETTTIYQNNKRKLLKKQTYIAIIATEKRRKTLNTFV